MLFLFPQSLFYQSPPASSLIPHPARTGINHLREQHYRAEIASSLKMTKVYTCKHVHKTHTHLHVLQSPHSCHPACFWHKHSPPHLQHTHSVCVCHQSGGLKTTNSRSLQGREGAATEVLICCCYRVCVGQVTSLPLFSDNRSFTQQWHYAPSTAIHRLLGKTRIPAVVDKHKSTHAQALWNTPIPATQGMHTNILTCTYTSSGCSICRHLSTTHMHLS